MRYTWSYRIAHRASIDLANSTYPTGLADYDNTYISETYELKTFGAQDTRCLPVGSTLTLPSHPVYNDVLPGETTTSLGYLSNGTSTEAIYGLNYRVVTFTDWIHSSWALSAFPSQADFHSCGMANFSNSSYQSVQYTGAGWTGGFLAPNIANQADLFHALIYRSLRWHYSRCSVSNSNACTGKFSMARRLY